MATKQRYKHYKLGEKYNDLYLTQREAECALLMLRGKSVKSTAKSLGLSPRTIEFYLKNMKKKLNCASKGHFIETVLDSDFLSDPETMELKNNLLDYSSPNIPRN